MPSPEQRGWLAEMLARPSRPVMSAKDKKTARYRVMARARDRERGNAGQLEEQRHAIEEHTDRIFQEAADFHRMPLHSAGKVYYPR